MHDLSHSAQQGILLRVREALALHRQTGFTFLGHLLRLPPDLAGDAMQTEIEALPYCSDENGEVDLVSFGIFADVSISRSIRGAINYYGRMATANLNISLSGRRRTGRLVAKANVKGYVAGSEMKQTQSQIEISGPEGPIGSASGLFMLDLSRPMVTPKKFPDDLPPLPLDEFDEGERWIYGRAETSLERAAADGRAFASHFWGIETQQTEGGALTTIDNNLHVSNRSGHLQGGVQLGTVCRSAEAALGADWMMTGVNATYMRPGMTKAMKAVSTIVYRGRLTAFIVTQILDADERLILQASSTHARRQGT